MGTMNIRRVDERHLPTLTARQCRIFFWIIEMFRSVLGRGVVALPQRILGLITWLAT